MEIKTLNSIIDEVSKNGSFGNYKWYWVSATVSCCKSDLSTVVYEGCPIESCKTKVIPKGGGFYCSKCGYTYKYFQYRYKLKVFLDNDGKMVVTMFDDNAISFLKKTAPELVEIHRRDIEEYNTILKSRNHQKFYFKIKAAKVTFCARNDHVKFVNVIVDDYEKSHEA